MGRSSNYPLARSRTIAVAMAMVLPISLSITDALAKTPDDVLVQAWQINDITSLDPAEIFELAGAEYDAQIYDRLVTYSVDDVENLKGHVAESWEIGEDGKTYTFKIRNGITFHSGNALTADDAAWSLQRVIKLGKEPSFILSQFGFTDDNVDEMIKAIDERTLQVTLDQAYAPTFFLYCLTSSIGSIVDKQEVMSHAKNGDMGHEWLRTASAGSGPFKLRTWKPNESIIIDAHPDYWGGSPSLNRIFIRHVPEPATQQLLLEQGNIDIARGFEGDQAKAIEDNDDVVIEEVPKGAIWYLGLNQKNEYLAKPKVREALKYLIDYEGMASTILAGSATVHQSFLPQGFLGAIDDKPYSLDIDKAKGLLEEAGLGEGFKVTMDTPDTSAFTDMAKAIQATWAKAGVDLEILPGDDEQTMAKYRARTHDIYIGRWGPDYQDPHTNADTFASNPGNKDEDGHADKLAWRNAWDIPEMTALTAAAVLEHDPETRNTMYQELQREHQAISPFVIMFQDIELIASSKEVSGMIWGPSFDDSKYWKVTKQ